MQNALMRFRPAPHIEPQTAAMAPKVTISWRVAHVGRAAADTETGHAWIPGPGAPADRGANATQPDRPLAVAAWLCHVRSAGADVPPEHDCARRPGTSIDDRNGTIGAHTRLMQRCGGLPARRLQQRYHQAWPHEARHAPHLPACRRRHRLSQSRQVQALIGTARLRACRFRASPRRTSSSGSTADRTPDPRLLRRWWG